MDSLIAAEDSDRSKLLRRALAEKLQQKASA